MISLVSTYFLSQCSGLDHSATAPPAPPTSPICYLRQTDDDLAWYPRNAQISVKVMLGVADYVEHGDHLNFRFAK